MNITKSIDTHLETCPLDDTQKIRAKELILKYWNVIGDELVQMVDKIHGLPQTTQNNYGAYLGLIGTLTDAKIDPPMIGVLLKLAGCDRTGLATAYKYSQGDI
jgi:hypothetical protein